MKINVEGKIERERPKNMWLDTIRNDKMDVDMSIGDVEN